MNASGCDEQKEVEFYAASVAAWYSSSLEYDKSLFALSAGGIALLVTLLTTVGFSSWLVLALFIAAIVSFLTCLGAVLTIFRKNSKYLVSVLNKKGPAHDPLLRRLDLVAIVAFAAGTLFASGVGVATALDSFQTSQLIQEKRMATRGDSKTPQSLGKSFSGAADLKPVVPRSFNEAANLQPQAPAPAPAPAPGQVISQPESQATSVPVSKERGK